VIQDQLDHKEFKVWLAILAHKALLDLKGMQVLQARLDLLDLKVI
jgi:hypothetical protein